MNIAELRGEALDYEMYRHACKVSGKQASKEEFDGGYGNGQFRFHQDEALLLDLVETYRINVQFLANEWLASNERSSVWGDTPLVAVCRLVLILNPN